MLALSLIRQREKSQSTVRETAKRLGSKFPNSYAQYEKGKIRISLEQYEKLLTAANPDYKPFRTEWLVFDGIINEDNKRYGKVSGSIDMTYENSLGQIVIVDWKRVGKLNDCYNNKHGKGIFLHIQDTKFNHYSLQLNCYRHIIEKWYGKEVIGMYLAVFHPDNDGYIMRKVERMDKEIDNLWNTL